MARDKITVDLMLATKQAEREIARINRKLGDLGKTMGKAFGGTGAGGDKVRALGTGLSKATVKADEFSKSMEASNARVIAFGASAGLIMGVDRALRAMVASAIKVEKAMMDVNVVMNVSTQALDKFGKGMFRVAKETAQSFEVVAEASTELARQGLGAEKTLQRTKDALILTRLTGMKAADAVKTLTAAVNSFNKEGVTSADVINRMAKVDAKFAVSSDDLAKSISRVGASAVSAGVNMNELMAITTAVQQKTARGGAVIGNAFKTIFTRIQRSEVKQKLSNIGVATTDMSGKMLSGIKVLQNLAANFDKLTKSQQSSISENVAGVFQVNILKAALSDLSQETSAYSGALRAANSATDDAYQKNEKLNQTLDSLVNRTLANLTQAGASLGGGLFGPAIENILGTVNKVIESFGEGGAMEGFGQTIGKGLMTGMGKFIGGPGLIMATAVFAKVALSLGKFARQALMDVVGINTATKQRKALEEAVVATIAAEPALLAKVKAGTLNVLTVEKQILNTIKLQTAERAKLQAYAAPIAGALMGRGARVGGKGAFMKGGPGGAAGFVPNFADAGSERAAAAAGGYSAGSIRTMSQPGAGTMMYNSAETVKRFPGMSQSAIMPPQESPAGAGYKSAFGAAHGFDPYAATGFVPNFNPLATARAGGGYRQMGTQLRHPKAGRVTTGKSKTFDPDSYYGALIQQGGHLTTQRIAMLVPAGKGSGKGHATKGAPPYNNFSGSFPIYQWSPQRLKSFGSKSNAVPDVSEMMNEAAVDITRTFAAKVKPPADPKLIEGDKTLARLQTTGGGKGALDGAAGAVFEAGMALALGVPAAAQDTGMSRGDFDLRTSMFGGTAPMSSLRGSRMIFGGKFSMGDFKIGSGDTSSESFVAKMAKELVYGAPGSGLIKHDPEGRRGKKGKALKRGKALGFVPNFSPVTSAIGREMASGVPASAIRVGSSPFLRGAGNPGGVGVYNTIHEPGGLSQGISRARTEGINPRGYGAAEGLVPNFVPAAGAAVGWLKKIFDMFKSGKAITKIKEVGGKIPGKYKHAAGEAGDAARSRAGTAAVMGTVAGGALEGWGGIGAGIGMGAAGGFVVGGGIPGALVGGLGALAFEIPNMISLLMSSSEEATEALEEEIEKQLSLAEAAHKVAQELAGLNKEMGVSELLTLKRKKFSEMEKENPAEYARMKDTKEFKTAQEAGSLPKYQAAIEAYRKRSVQKEMLLTPTQKRRTGDLTFDSTFEKQMLERYTPRNRIQLMAEEANAMAKDPTKFGGSWATVQAGTKGRTGYSSFPGQTDISSETTANSLQGRIDAIRAEITFLKTSISAGGAEIGGIAGRQYLSSLAGGGMDKQQTYASMVERRVNFEELQSNIRGAGSAEERVALATGFNVEDIKPVMDMLRKTLSPEQMEAFNASLVRGYTDIEAYNDAVHDATMLEKEREKEARKMMDVFREAAKSQEMWRKYAHTMKLAQEAEMRGIAHQKKLNSMQDGYTMALANATKDQRGVALDKRGVSIGLAGRTFEDSMQSAKSKFSTDAAKSLAGLDFIKFAESQKFTPERAQEALERFKEYRSGNINLETLREDLMNTKGAKLLGALSPEELADDKKLQGVIDSLQGHLNDLDRATKGATDQKGKDVVVAKEAYDIQLKTIKLQVVLNTSRRQENRLINAAIKSKELEEAKILKERGQIGARGYASAYSASLAGDVAARGVQKEDFGRAFKAGFVNEMGYEPADLLQDWESGTRSVAQNMKSSFADAFQSISSGADSLKGALANMAQSILNSISSISANMFSNMMFSKMGFSQGGLVPGYAGGGVVMGGSGHKDDVPTMMQGGEFVIKKSSAQKIGYGNLNAINGYAEGGPTKKGGPSMGQLGLVAAGASAASGLIGAAMADSPQKPLPSQDYGFGKGKYGYFGGPDPDAGQVDTIGGGARRASVSLGKGFVYYRRDPETGQLVSEKARPTEGRFEVSQRLSLLGRLGRDDPQTSRMFGKEQTMAKYQDYLVAETKSRKDQIDAVKKQKRQRLIGAYMNAAMLIGGAKWMGGATSGADVAGPGGQTYSSFEGSGGQAYGLKDMGFGNQGYGTGTGSSLMSGTAPSNWWNNSSFTNSVTATTGSSWGKMGAAGPGGAWGPSVGHPNPNFGKKPGPALGGYMRHYENGGSASGTPAMVMGGEYIMSPETVRTYGSDFMHELNRGNVAGSDLGGSMRHYEGGGSVPTGNQGSSNETLIGGNTTNNVKLNINIDKGGKTEASATSSGDKGSSTEDEQEEVQKNKELGEVLQGVVLQELVKQQRPGGLLNRGTSGTN